MELIELSGALSGLTCLMLALFSAKKQLRCALGRCHQGRTHP